MPLNKIEQSIMLDYYGELLTNHQVDILDEYLNEDLSMNEIADNYHISKAAVQDLIKRSMQQLENYEKVLKLIEKDNKISEVLEQMKSEKNLLLDKYVKKLEKIK